MLDVPSELFVCQVWWMFDKLPPQSSLAGSKSMSYKCAWFFKRRRYLLREGLQKIKMQISIFGSDHPWTTHRPPKDVNMHKPLVFNLEWSDFARNSKKCKRMNILGHFLLAGRRLSSITYNCNSVGHTLLLCPLNLDISAISHQNELKFGMMTL